MKDEQRELLAAYSHEAWAQWMKYMLEEGGMSWIQGNDNGPPVYYWMMNPEKYDHWQRQMNTPYAELPESEKASDRAEADKIRRLLGLIL